MCIGPEGDMNDKSVSECTKRMADAGASLIGINCHFGPKQGLETIKLMKDELDKNNSNAHIMIQSLAYHTPDCDKHGFIDLPDF